LINATPALFQSYCAEKHFGFAVWGENPASVSQFVAEIRHGDPTFFDQTFSVNGDHGQGKPGTPL
jgi:hypothetical protein